MLASRKFVLPLAALLALAGAMPAAPRLLAQTSAASPDNSAQNKNQMTTADNQPNAKADRLTTAGIRKAIIADKDLSMYAHNVKIVTVGGSVTLKGPVKTEEEKQKVAADAATVVSADKITNQLTVKP